MILKPATKNSTRIKLKLLKIVQNQRKSSKTIKNNRVKHKINNWSVYIHENMPSHKNNTNKTTFSENYSEKPPCSAPKSKSEIGCRWVVRRFWTTRQRNRSKTKTACSRWWSRAFSATYLRGTCLSTLCCQWWILSTLYNIVLIFQ